MGKLAALLFTGILLLSGCSEDYHTHHYVVHHAVVHHVVHHTVVHHVVVHHTYHK